MNKIYNDIYFFDLLNDSTFNAHINYLQIF